MPASVFTCSHDNDWYFHAANYISVENYDVNIKFLHLDGSAGQFIRPSLEETCWIPIHDIIVDPSLYGSTVQFYCFDCDEMNCAKKLM